MKERAKMADHEMLNLDEMGTLKDSMELLGEELMNGHRINPNLYVEYDVKRGLRDSAGKGVTKPSYRDFRRYRLRPDQRT